MSESSDILQLFPWITSGFIEKLLEKSEDAPNVALKSFSATRAFNKGEGFSSYMFSLRVVFDNGADGEKQRNFLMKIAIQTDEYAKICEECLIYEREIEAYTKVLPALERSFEKLGIPGQIAPRYIERIFKLLDFQV